MDHTAALEATLAELELRDAVIAAAQRQVDELATFAEQSTAFCETERTELRRWLAWRNKRFLEVDLDVLDALRRLERRPGIPFFATGTDVIAEMNGSSQRFYVALRRLEHAGVLERHAKPGKGTWFRLLRPSAAA